MNHFSKQKFMNVTALADENKSGNRHIKNVSLCWKRPLFLKKGQIATSNTLKHTDGDVAGRWARCSKRRKLTFLWWGVIKYQVPHSIPYYPPPTTHTYKTVCAWVWDSYSIWKQRIVTFCNLVGSVYIRTKRVCVQHGPIHSILWIICEVTSSVCKKTNLICGLGPVWGLQVN